MKLNVFVYNHNNFFIFRLESFIILKAGIIRISIRAISVISISTIMYIIFVPYTATGGELTPKKFIVILSQLILLRLTMFYFLTQTILSLVEGKVAAVRIQVRMIIV